MSKLDELRKAIQAGKNEYCKYQDECIDFVEKFMNGMVDYFEIPEGHFRYLPLDESEEEGRSYSLIDIMKLEDDTFWHLRLEIKLAERTILHLYFKVKKENDIFVLKGIDDPSLHNINPNIAEDFIKYYDYIFNNLIDEFQNGFKNWLKSKKQTFGIRGFI